MPWLLTIQTITITSSHPAWEKKHPPIQGCWLTTAHIWPGQWSGQDCFAKVITSSSASLFAIVIDFNDDDHYNCDDYRQVTLNTWHKVRFIRSGLEASLQVGKTTTNKTNTTITTLPNQPRNNLHNRSHQDYNQCIVPCVVPLMAQQQQPQL